ncbi:hypothetical protein BGW80DRAFT_529047 [Lactifluus volemus]|nr:hypothetical protein BGW80DRAFT_529047 [Lactifluus volemus]
MVPELGHQPYMCSFGDIVTTVGTPVYHSHSPTTIQSTQPSTDPCIFFDGVERLHLPRAVETLPTLLHLSLFLFFFGLLIFLFNINHTAFRVVAWWIGLSGGLYGCITLMPIFFHDSPYYAPLSFTVWFLYNGILYGIFHFWIPCYFRFCSFNPRTWYRSLDLFSTYRDRTLWGIVKTAQETATKSSQKIDGHILNWIFDSLDADGEVEEFCEGIPGFCSSKWSTSLKKSFINRVEYL